ncbi:MAG: hypothetical protein IJT79_09050 [Ruminococcus sp.]|nr:hypothetical protein [Ruminococcus sp.]
MLQYNIERFINNIKIILNENAAKEGCISSIGELEKEAGISIGFISRVNQKKTSRFTIEQADKIAELLEIPLLDLMYSDLDYAPLNKSMKTIKLFVDRLIKDTQDGDLFWCHNYNKFLENELSANAYKTFVDDPEMHEDFNISSEGWELRYKTEQFGDIQLGFNDYYFKVSLDGEHTIYLIESKDNNANLIVLKSFDAEDLIAYKIAEKSSLPESTLDLLFESVRIRSMDVDVSYNGHTFIDNYLGIHHFPQNY